MTNPLDVMPLDEVPLRPAARRAPSSAPRAPFDGAVASSSTRRGKLRDLGEDEEPGVAEEAALADDPSIIEIVDSLISDAVSMKASDIHVEPHAGALHVRCRNDGGLHKLRELPSDVQAGVISRIKIMGNMDIAERRMPQDGRTSFETSDGKAVDLRLASIPTLHGENVSIRILEVSPLLPSLDALGLAGASLERFEQAVARPEGGILICGPTGCGKSTTLYTTLDLIKSPQSKIYTLEDPIERRLEGVMQSEVRPAIGLDFAGPAAHCCAQPTPTSSWSGRSGTPRPRAWRPMPPSPGTSALHLHTRDAASIVHRLIEMGVPPLPGGRGRQLCRRPSASCGAVPPLPQVEERSRGSPGRSSAWARRRAAS